jgi:hypothetical protein
LPFWFLFWFPFWRRSVSCRPTHWRGTTLRIPTSKGSGARSATPAGLIRAKVRASHSRLLSLRNIRHCSKLTSRITPPAERDWLRPMRAFHRACRGSRTATARSTHITVEHINDNRRIYTDGRPWPSELEPTALGYSIGTWIDADGDGRYDVLEVETRGFAGSRTFDDSGIPLHADDESVVKERIYLDRSDANVFHDEVTVIDHALTKPWTVTKSYRRAPDREPHWREVVCAETNNHLAIGKQDYLVSPDGRLMPTRQDQPPPDLRYFNRDRK